VNFAGNREPGKLRPVSKKISRPAWWKNTYFWLAGILLLLAILGLFFGDRAVRDPGQKKEGLLWLFYLVASIVMFVNGWVSHRQTILNYREQMDNAEN